jgi:hypothetical protein
VDLFEINQLNKYKYYLQSRLTECEKSNGHVQSVNEVNNANSEREHQRSIKVRVFYLNLILLFHN